MFSFALVFISLTVTFSLFFNYYCMTDKCQMNTQIKKKTTLNKREYAPEIYKTKGLFMCFSY